MEAFSIEKPKFCYWSIGDKDYAYTLETLVKTARNVGITDDFHVWSDRKIKGATTHRLLSPTVSNHKGNDLYFCEFKLKYLREMVNMDYDYFVYIDSDSYFVRKPRNPLVLLNGDPMHMFLETNFVENPALTKAEWWGCPFHVLAKAMWEMGVKCRKIYNVSGGFFIINRKHVFELHELTTKFWFHLHNLGYNVPDEPGLSYAMHMLCTDTGKHLLKDNLDFYGFYVTPESSIKLPDGQPWLGEEFFTGGKTMANPAIVHCYFSKQLLMEFSMRLGEKLLFRSRNFLRKLKARLARGILPKEM